MQNNLTVKFNRVDRSHELVHYIEAEAQGLFMRHCCIESCKVVIEKPNSRHNGESRLRAKVLVRVPGKQLFSSRETYVGMENEEARIAVTEAFDAIEDSVNSLVHRWCEPKHCPSILV